MIITKEIVYKKIKAYLMHEIAIEELIEWAESAMMDSDFDDNHFDVILDVIARIGIADVKAFGLTLEDLEDMLHKLGYSIKYKIELVD